MGTFTITHHEGIDERLADVQDSAEEFGHSDPSSAAGAVFSPFRAFLFDTSRDAIGLARLATSPDALPGLVDAVTHPGDTIKNAYVHFSNESLAEKGLGIAEFLATGGAEGLIGAGKLAWQGAKAGYGFARDAASDLGTLTARVRSTFVEDAEAEVPFTAGVAEGQVASQTASQIDAMAGATHSAPEATIAARALADTSPENELAAGARAAGEVKAQQTAAEIQQGTIYDYSKSAELGTHSSISELLATGYLPGDFRAGGGVILTDRTVRFGDIYELSTLNGRRVEFSLTSEIRGGQNVKVLYSGTVKDVVTPRDARIIGHSHPTPHDLQQFPSPGDMETFNNIYFRQQEVNPNALPQPSRIFFGSGDYDNTIFYPGFGKWPS